MNEQIILEEEEIAEERALELARLGSAISRGPIRGLPTLKPAICIDPSASLRAAVEEMNEHSVGCVLVVDATSGRLVGVLTERDLLTRVIPQQRDIDATKVKELMTADPECLTLDDGIAYALNKMSVGGFRHIPLVDAEGRPTGVVSMRNVVDFIVDLFPQEVLNLPPAPALGISRSREGA
jgi:CBS domain-containing protein